MPPSSSPPNVVVVVLDCVRASDFVGADASAPSLRFCEELKRDSVVFPRAISPAPWTIPSHASLFTGLAPWETGCHWKGSLQLSSSLPRLPTVLAGRGYRTMSLSANPLIEPSFGMMDGFQQAAWSGWWEPFLRYFSTHAPHVAPQPPNGHSSRLATLRTGPVDAMIKRVRPTLIQHPAWMARGNRILHNFRGENGNRGRSIAQWVEPTFNDWVRRTPSDQPLFAFVNLLDAHEPYFPDVNFADWRAYTATRQDPVAWMNGDWEARPENLALIHRLYRQMIEGMDRRVETLVDVLRRAGRWENTALILTADHGQAFGEHGTLFHFFRVDEQLLRVPLWIRLPEGQQAGTRPQTWASLTDIAATVLDLAGSTARLSPRSEDLTRLLDRDRREPVAAISDGVVWGHFRSRFSPTGIERFDRVYAASYAGEMKVVSDMKSGATVAFDVRRDPAESHDLWTDSTEMQRLRSVAQDAGGRLLFSSPSTLTPDVEDRLSAWGYV